MSNYAERRQRRSRWKQRKWPKWVRSKRLIRWLFLGGAFVYRLWRLVRFFIGSADE